MAYQHLLVERNGPIGRLTLNRPDERNAMSPEMGDELRAAVDELNGAAAVRVVVVRGAGKAFSAGGNLSNLEAEAEAGGRASAGGLGGGASRTEDVKEGLRALREKRDPSFAGR